MCRFISSFLILLTLAFFVEGDDVRFHLFTRQNQNKSIEITSKNVTQLIKEPCKIVFLVHGWTQKWNEQWIKDLSHALFLHKVCNIIVVDYEEIADQLYTLSVLGIPTVGRQIAEVIKPLSKFLDNIILIGHSLGGQVVALAANDLFKDTDKKVGRIIGLDPAGPLFWGRPDNLRLTPDDAEFVEVIHTDPFFGYTWTCGSLDIYPNGGFEQPGCPSGLTGLTQIFNYTCSHHRSIVYFTYALKHKSTLLAAKCGSYNDFKDGECNDTQLIDLGDLEVKKRGSYYLTTSAKAPYKVAP